MIIKSFETTKIELDKNKFVLLYGKNNGFKTEVTNNLLKDKIEIKKYEEKEILEKYKYFFRKYIF